MEYPFILELLATYRGVLLLNHRFSPRDPHTSSMIGSTSVIRGEHHLNRLDIETSLGLVDTAMPHILAEYPGYTRTQNGKCSLGLTGELRWGRLGDLV